MPIKRTLVESGLSNKGFVLAEGDHRYFTYHTTVGKKSPIFTKTSHGSGHKDVSDELISRMSKQVKLTSGKFRDLVSCTFSREDYEIQLVTDGHLKTEECKKSSSD